MAIDTQWEGALVGASQDGNHQAIETLFRRYQRQLPGTARRILGNIEDAEGACRMGFFRRTARCRALKDVASFRRD
jgi:DNA-directed RNA polymerase specialized sigma24 family protein